jgi:hypothetical protein
MSRYQLDVRSGGTQLIDSPMQFALRSIGFAPTIDVSHCADPAAAPPQAGGCDAPARISCTDALARCMADSALGG